MQALVQRNYVEQDPSSRAYSLGSRLLELGIAYAGNLDLIGAARPRIEALRDRAAETVHLAILANREVVEICTASGRQAVTVSRGTGRRDPAHCTATGKVLLAALPDSDIERFLAQGALRPATPRSICDVDALRAELVRVREQGFAVDDEELCEDVCCIGVAIRNSDRAIAAVSLAMPKARFRAGELSRWVGMLHETSLQISRALVFSGDG
jgi:DNA-binding IclR family transcriptional regulator